MHHRIPVLLACTRTTGPASGSISPITLCNIQSCTSATSVRFSLCQACEDPASSPGSLMLHTTNRPKGTENANTIDYFCPDRNGHSASKRHLRSLKWDKHDPRFSAPMPYSCHIEFDSGLQRGSGTPGHQRDLVSAVNAHRRNS